MSATQPRRGSRHNMDRREYLSTGARLYAKRGQQLPHARLTDHDIAQIQRMHARKQRLVAHLNARYSAAGLARQFGVSQRAIERVLARETWAHVRHA
ncbi:hypothetical protein PWG14_25320 [Chromobacterium amazonense]|nr:hypothetical protein [Chromobacterium amazonense]